MYIKQLPALKNECYISNINSKRSPVGMVWHDAGAVNPDLRRWVQPVGESRNKDSEIGVNTGNNDWCNTARPDGQQKCCHAWIGLLTDKRIATAQILPWDINDWNSGSGSKGSAWRLGFCEIEIARSTQTDVEYLKMAYQEAVEVTASMFLQYGLDPLSKTKEGIYVLTDHSEIGKLGYGTSGKVDISDYLKVINKTMDDARIDVKAQIEKLKNPVVTVEPQILYRVQVGSFGVKQNAENYLKEIKKIYPDAFIQEYVK